MSRCHLARRRQLSQEFERYGIHIVSPPVRVALVLVPVTTRPVAASTAPVLAFVHGSARNAS